MSYPLQLSFSIWWVKVIYIALIYPYMIASEVVHFNVNLHIHFILYSSVQVIMMLHCLKSKMQNL